MLSKNDKAKMVLYNALPKMDYERIFMCKTTKDVWNSLVITHQALDESFSSRNHVRKFLRALPTKWRPKVTTIEESKDLSTLLLDQLIDNLKVYEVVLEKDSGFPKEYAMAVWDFNKFFRRKGKFVRQPHNDKKNFRRAKEEKKGKEERRCFKYGDPNHFMSDCPKHSFNDQKAFVRGCWSDSKEDDDSKKDEICLIAHDTNEGIGFAEDKSSTSEVKTGKMGQENTKVSSVEPAHTVPSAKVPGSENERYHRIASAKEILKPILQNRSEFVHVTKKTLPSATLRLKVKLEPGEWIKDSGCSRHMTGNKDLFSTYEAINRGNVVFGSNAKS
ncbi:zf-CCHC domain-containing protein [Tanacetum coccineum]